MQHLDEGTIHAWLDGALAADEAASVDAHVQACAECQSRVAEARGLIAASSRILSALDNVPSGVIPARAPRRKRWYDRADFRAAAAVLLVAGASVIVVRFSGQNSAKFSASVPAERAATLSSSTADSMEPKVANQLVQSLVAPSGAEASKTPTAKIIAGETRGEKKVTAAEPERLQKNESPLSMSGALGGGRRLDEADAQRAAAPMAVAAAPPALDKSKDSGTVINATVGASLGNFMRAKGASEVENDLRLVRTDTIGVDTQRSVYQVASGVQVTLTDSPESVDELRDAPAPSPAVMREAARLPAAVAKAAPTINTISWKEGNRRYTLSGPLSVSELEAIKSRLMKLKR